LHSEAPEKVVLGVPDDAVTTVYARGWWFLPFFLNENLNMLCRMLMESKEKTGGRR